MKINRAYRVELDPDNVQRTALLGLLEAYFNSHGVEIEWTDEVLGKSYEEELVEDILSLMASFSARIYGKRSAENRKRAKEMEAAK